MNNMKRILYIAPHCYPIKSSESICNSKVAYTLAKGGYCVDVYTCIESSTYPEDKVLDGVLRESDNLNISYVRGRIITRTLTLLDFIRCIIHYAILYMKTGYYYNGLDYSYQIMRKVKDRMDREGIRYDIMITRGFNTDYAGLYLHEKLQIGMTHIQQNVFLLHMDMDMKLLFLVLLRNCIIIFKRIYRFILFLVIVLEIIC